MNFGRAGRSRVESRWSVSASASGVSESAENAIARPSMSCESKVACRCLRRGNKGEDSSAEVTRFVKEVLQLNTEGSKSARRLAH